MYLYAPDIYNLILLSIMLKRHIFKCTSQKCPQDTNIHLIIIFYGSFAFIS